MSNVDEPLFPVAGAEQELSDPQLPERIRRLVGRQPYAGLCTQSRSQPYGSVVAFAFHESLRQAVLAKVDDAQHRLGRARGWVQSERSARHLRSYGARAW